MCGIRLTCYLTLFSDILLAFVQSEEVAHMAPWIASSGDIKADLLSFIILAVTSQQVKGMTSITLRTLSNNLVKSNASRTLYAVP
jgi:hypothetical protein